ncbi:hypothetical protein H0I76_05970 [Limibaculum sp. M0105]|uniref:Uncharacterized protein n=1 Tax=Thermohalobaculum xanthum TaxID=2753746 RepID=A0A8J7SE21_9RHOB|nr:hypothetical protein [Thermohalobaculum xanthum]MBK0398727.1 hypothetical protein [Thermohalobaculum xanthum]
MIGSRLGGALLAVSFFAVTPAMAAERAPEVTQADAEEASRAVAYYCKVVSERISGIISDQWATQDLQDLASVWRDLNCHHVFGVDERVRLRVR